jgi:hypothetical protein
VIGFRQPAMRGGLSGRQADHIDFGAAFVIKPQAPAKCSRFVIRMRSNAKYAWHPKIVSEVRVGADASSAQPSEARLSKYRQPAVSQQTEKTDTAARAPKRWRLDLRGFCLFENFFFFFFPFFEHEAQHFLRNRRVPHRRERLAVQRRRAMLAQRC